MIQAAANSMVSGIVRNKRFADYVKDYSNYSSGFEPFGKNETEEPTFIISQGIRLDSIRGPIGYLKVDVESHEESPGWLPTLLMPPVFILRIQVCIVFARLLSLARHLFWIWNSFAALSMSWPRDSDSPTL